MIVLRPLELAYQGVATLRRNLYASGRLKQKRLPRPVISIGNIAFGGSGKTPTTIALAKLLHGAGKRPVVLTRGHGRKDVDLIERVTSLDAERFGDEPVIIAAALPDVPVIVGRDRYKAAMSFLESEDCDFFVLDDGFQHVSLHRDCDVVLFSSRSKVHREPFRALERASIVLLREGSIPLRLPPQTPVMRADLELVSVRYEGRREPLDMLRGKRVFAFSGLADNTQFFASLERAGGVVVETHSMRDHATYTSELIDRLEQRAAALDALAVTTSKDAAKINRDSIAVVEAEIKFDMPDILLQYVIGMLEERRG
jgi:tetraacyldisaccharide 4'-kinase